MVDGIKRAELDNFLDSDKQFELDGDQLSMQPATASKHIRGERDRWHTAAVC